MSKIKNNRVIILYTRRNVGMYCLSYLVSKGFVVKVITDDDHVKWLAGNLDCDLIDFESIGNFDLFICIHGNKIIEESILNKGMFINIHPCLFKYKGHNPIRKYIKNGDTLGSVESQKMILEVDSGDVIHQEFFHTNKCNTYAEFYNEALPYYFMVLSKTLEKIFN